MTPYYAAPDLTLWQGDSLAVLKTLPDASVQCAITSPPFFQLRNYDVAGQIGIEPTLSEYLDRLVAVFAEVRRVLKPDGLLHVECGDSYAGAGYSNHANTGGAQRADGGKQKHSHEPTFRSKQLMLVPHRLAIALGDAGWLLRSDNVWHRPNPMPESVTDRTTRAHSYVFMFAKQSAYFYDSDAVREAAAEGTSRQATGWGQKIAPHDGFVRSNADYTNRCRYVAASANRRSVWTIPTQSFPESHFATFPEALIKPLILCSTKPGDVVLDCFSGAGTTMLVARQLGRIGWGIELSEKYCGMSVRRLEGQTPAMNLEVPA